MGGTPSSEAAIPEPITKNQYKTPDVREKERFHNVEDSSGNYYEPVVDKYDFVICFRKSEGENFATSSDMTKITWKDMKDIWSMCVAGSEKAKQKALNALRTHWIKRVQTEPIDVDSIAKGVFISIVRAVVIEHLVERAGLQIKINKSDSTGYIYCRVRAPMKLLELQAAQENYKLEYKGEIDPGSEEFWNREINQLILEEEETEEDDDEKGEDGEKKRVLKVVSKPVELELEAKEYSRAESNKRLERLYNIGKIDGSELGVPASVEDNSMLSRRVHALERFVDRVPVWNHYPAYGEFTTAKHLRYLFRVHEGVRGNSLFRTKDRLYLLKSLIDRHFDFERMREVGLISFMSSLHDANRGERLTIDVLMKRWVTFWEGHDEEVGSPLVTDEAYEPDMPVIWILRPLSQPLSDIREYFGEKVALFFAWLGHYTYFLLLPVAFMFLMYLSMSIYRPNEAEIDYRQVVTVLFVVTWVVFYTTGWSEQSKVIALKWGTCGFESIQKDRPQFKGEFKSDGTNCRSVVDNKKVQYYPESKRETTKLFSYVIITACIVIVICTNIATFFLMKRAHMKNNVDTSSTDPNDVVTVFSQYLIYGLYTPLFSYFYRPISIYLNDLENYKTDVDYEDALIAKSLIFQLFNNFTAPFFVAFAKKPLFNDCVGDLCINDVRQLLICIFVLRYIFLLLNFLVPFVESTVYQQQQNQARLSAAGIDADGESSGELEDPELNFFVDETYLAEYQGPFNDYSDTIIQFGYVVFFMTVVPLIAFLALFENLIKIRLSAWKICFLYRRPFVELVEDVGLWSKLMETMGGVGLVVNTALIVFTSNSFISYPIETKWVIFLSAEQFLLVYKTLLSWCIPSPSELVEDLTKRNEFITDKYQKGIFEGEEEEIEVEKGHVDDPVDVDATQLYEARKSRMNQESYKLMETLEDERRDLDKELRAVKLQLQEAYATETYNDFTGIGETKHGLPLGRLHVKLLEIQSLMGKNSAFADERPPEVKIRVNIEWAGRREQTMPGPPIGDHSFSKVAPLSEEGNVVFDQVLGPFAPIRSLDANAVFDVLDTRPEMNNAVIGKAKVGLRELQDQQRMQKLLTIEIMAPESSNEEDVKKEYAKMYLTLHFKFSRVLPLRTKIYHIQDSIRGIDKKLSLIKQGKHGEVED